MKADDVHVPEGSSPGMRKWRVGKDRSDLDRLVNNRLITAMDEVGRRFSGGIMFVPEMFLTAQTFQACLGIMRLFLVEPNKKKFGTVVIDTVSLADDKAQNPRETSRRG